MATQLSPHFTLEEMCFSSTAVRLGIDNTPTPEIVAHLTVLANALEPVRALLGHPMHIDSGYRCSALNKAIGGAPNSAHMDGYAADFVCPDFGSPLEIVKAIALHELPDLYDVASAMGEFDSGDEQEKVKASMYAKTVLFDQLIQEGTWVHISFAPTMRGQVLTAHFVNGIAHYQGGIAVS